MPRKNNKNLILVYLSRFKGGDGAWELFTCLIKIPSRASSFPCSPSLFLSSLSPSPLLSLSHSRPPSLSLLLSIWKSCWKLLHSRYLHLSSSRSCSLVFFSNGMTDMNCDVAAKRTKRTELLLFSFHYADEPSVQFRNSFAENEIFDCPIQFICQKFSVSDWACSIWTSERLCVFDFNEFLSSIQWFQTLSPSRAKNYKIMEKEEEEECQCAQYTRWWWWWRRCQRQ